MANPEHVEILKQGVKAWNEWWGREYDRLRADFREADLSNQDLAGADFLRADFRKANLSGANLRKARLHRAILTGANLNGAMLDACRFSVARLNGADLLGASLMHANFGGADLSSADLSGANLTSALLRNANLTGAILEDTDFWDARASGTVFADLDLSVAKHLTEVRHFGPSTIGIDTVYKSKGRIPEAFLQGCGVPDEFITIARSVRDQQRDYYSCFISYSTKDQAFADRLYADLQAKGVRCWFAPHDIMGGRRIHEQIDEAIRVHDKLLLILSEHSMASDWVGTEIADAREREARERKQMLFPITIAPFEEVREWKLFDADRGKDSAREIREYYIPDFSRWDSDNGAYQKEFERLVAALKAVVSG